MLFSNRLFVIIALLVVVALVGCASAEPPPVAASSSTSVVSQVEATAVDANVNPQPDPSLEPTALPVNQAGEPLVARVNGAEITRAEFEQALARYELQLPVVADETALQATVLDTLIEQVLIEQAAVAQNLVVTEEEVQAELDASVQIAGSPEAWQQWLALNQYTEEEFRESLRDTLLTGRVRDAVTASLGGVVPHVRARHILVATDADANEILTRLRNGEDFATLAATYSNDVTTREQGGDLGWFMQEELLAPALAQVAFALEPGLIAGPIQTSLGYHVIQTLEREDRPIPEERLAQLAQQRFEQWLDEQVESATIEQYL